MQSLEVFSFIGLVLIGGASAAALGDTCQVGMYNSGDDANVLCKACTKAPKDAYYKTNGNYKDECEFEKCSKLETPIGAYIPSCGFDEHNIFSVCGSIPANSYEATCQGTVDSCDLVALRYTDIGSGNKIDSCNSYCEQQGLDCQGAWTGNKCPSSRGSDSFAAKLACNAKFTGFPKSTGICRCKLKPVLECKDLNSVCFLLSPSCPAAPAEISALPLGDIPRRVAASQCRKSCNLCEAKNVVFDGSFVARASNYLELKPSERFVGPGVREGGKAPVATCTDMCGAGESNSGCGQFFESSMAKTFKHAFQPSGGYTVVSNFRDQDTAGCSICTKSCKVGEYISGTCDGSSFVDNTECKPCRTCGSDNYQAQTCPGNGKTDVTVCKSCVTKCDPGFYLDGKKCDGTSATTTPTVTCKTCFPDGCPERTFRDLRMFGGCSGLGFLPVTRCRKCELFCRDDKDEKTYPGCTEECYKTTTGFGLYDHVGGGYRNTAGDMPKSLSNYNLVIGGGNNRAFGKHKQYGATIGGGEDNLAGGASSFVGGGQENMGGDINQDYSTDTQDSVSVLGGYQNLAYQSGATIIGGRINTVMDDIGTIWGGYKNRCSFELCTIMGGFMNTVSNGGWSVVMGGTRNVVSTKFGVVMGGAKNTVAARFGTILGGSKNKVTGRWGIAGGWMSQALDDRSVAMQFYRAAGNKYCRSKKSGTMILCTESLYLQSTEPKRDLVLYTCCYGYFRYKKVICPKKTPGFPTVGTHPGALYKDANDYWSKYCKATFYGMDDEWDDYWDEDGNIKITRRLLEETGETLPPEEEDVEYGPHLPYAKMPNGAVLLPKTLTHMTEATSKHIDQVEEGIASLSDRMSILSQLVTQIKLKNM